MTGSVTVFSVEWPFKVSSVSPAYFTPLSMLGVDPTVAVQVTWPDDQPLRVVADDHCPSTRHERPDRNRGRGCP